MTFWQRARRELGRETQPIGTVVRLIIIERAVVGGLVLVLGLTLLTGSQQIGRIIRHWVSELNINPERRLIPRALVAILRPLGLLPTRTVVILGIGAILFAILELTEAIGLARRRRWAEYLTVIAGCIGIPFEVNEVVHKQTLLRVGALTINVAIVVYLAWQKHLFGLQGGVETETATS